MKSKDSLLYEHLSSGQRGEIRRQIKSEIAGIPKRIVFPSDVDPILKRIARRYGVKRDTISRVWRDGRLDYRVRSLGSVR